MKNLINRSSPSGQQNNSFEREFLSMEDVKGNRFPDGIPMMKFKSVNESIDMYKKLAAITILANSIIATMGFIYL